MDCALMQNALGSAAASIIARTFTHPLDTVKARLQANYQSSGSIELSKKPYRGPLDVLVRTVRTEGFLALYRGYSAVVVGGTPGTVMYLCSYEIVKKELTDLTESRLNRPLASSNAELLVHFVSGMLAESFACLIYVPVDVVKERMQVQHSTGVKAEERYRNSFDALQQIAKTEGFSGIYRGYAATLGSFGPFSAFYFVFYERFKHWARQHVSLHSTVTYPATDSIDIPFPELVLCSASAGALASFITSPLDMAKLRLQVQRGNLAKGGGDSQVLYGGVADCLKKVYVEHGVRGLFRGAGARMLHFAPATTITMTSYEKCRSFFGSLLSENRR